MSSPKTTLNETERDLLRHLSGEAVPRLAWGAAMSVSLEYLKGQGFVRGLIKHNTLTYEITDAGRAALAAG